MIPIAVKVKQNASLRNPCDGASLREAVQMIVVVQMGFAIFYAIHGIQLCTLKGEYDRVYGSIYVVSGFCYFSLAYLLWTISKQKKPSTQQCNLWILSSITIQMVTVTVTACRNGIEGGIWHVNIWILCGLFIQCFMIWVVYAFNKNPEEEDKLPVIPEPSENYPEPEPEQEPVKPPPDQIVDQNNEHDTVVIEPEPTESDPPKPDPEEIPPIDQNVTDQNEDDTVVIEPEPEPAPKPINDKIDDVNDQKSTESESIEQKSDDNKAEPEKVDEKAVMDEVVVVPSDSRPEKENEKGEGENASEVKVTLV